MAICDLSIFKEQFVIHSKQISARTTSTNIIMELIPVNVSTDNNIIVDFIMRQNEEGKREDKGWKYEALGGL